MMLLVCVCAVPIYICEDMDSYRNPHKLAVAEPSQPIRLEGWQFDKRERLLIDYRNDQRCKLSAILKLCSYLSNGYYLQLYSILTY